MASLHTIFQDIADIISDKSNTESLKLKIETDAFDWEKIVPVASKHLVIPLLYCKLKEKDLLDVLPKDLLLYLEEITNQNRDRNRTILKEVHEISILLNDNKIDHVFLKGAALMVSGTYKDIGERMIGDIDILVHPEQLIKAQNIFINDDYNSAEKSLTDKYFEQKHLSRLIPKTKLAAVEIHRKLLHRPVTGQVEPLKILLDKRIVDNIAIPDNKDLLAHTILNFEINDYGYYYNYLGIRNSYDTMILLERIDKEDFKTTPGNKYMISFFDKMSVYFMIPIKHRKKRRHNYRIKLFRLKQNWSLFAKLSYRFLSIVQFTSLVSNRFILFLKSSSYRKEAMHDHKRIIQLVKTKIKGF